MNAENRNCSRVKQKVLVASLLVFALALVLNTGTPIARAVTVGPVRINLNADPETSVKSSMFVQNESSEAQVFFPSYEGFTEVDGQKIFSKSISNDLPEWFDLPKSLEIPAGESRDIPFTIRVPKDAGPGSHYAVVWWSSAPPSNDGSKMAVVTRAGVLVYLRVSGDVHEEGSITSFGAKSMFAFSLPLDIATKFHNSGNIFVTPEGTVSLKNILGKTVSVSQVNGYKYIVMSGSDYTFNNQLNPPGVSVGLYKLQVDLTYGEKQTSIIKTAWILILPTWLLWCILGIIVLLFILPKILRRYNAWIIKNAQKG
ncbi:MAG: hypothetical protein V1489_02805 [Candidatus Liptonbacteria bacterium]